MVDDTDRIGYMGPQKKSGGLATREIRNRRSQKLDNSKSQESDESRTRQFGKSGVKESGNSTIKKVGSQRSQKLDNSESGEELRMGEVGKSGVGSRRNREPGDQK